MQPLPRARCRWRRRAAAGVTAAALLAGAAAGASAGATVAHYRYEHKVALNDRHVTPGAVFAVGTGTLCRPGYAESVRDVPEAEKLAIYRRYGIFWHAPGTYEIDHLIPLELGGTNGPANLWPEPNDHPPGYLNSKDMLENRLHELVCARRLPLTVAQHEIAANWVATFHALYGRWPAPAPSAAPATSASTGAGTPGAVRITSLVPTLVAGAEQTVRARSSRPDDICRLVVTLPSGRESTAWGIDTTRADAAGRVSWRWRILADTDPGRAAVVVSCGAGRAAASFTITAPR